MRAAPEGCPPRSSDLCSPVPRVVAHGHGRCLAVEALGAGRAQSARRRTPLLAAGHAAVSPGLDSPYPPTPPHPTHPRAGRTARTRRRRSACGGRARTRSGSQRWGRGPGGGHAGGPLLCVWRPLLCTCRVGGRGLVVGQPYCGGDPPCACESCGDRDGSHVWVGGERLTLSQCPLMPTDFPALPHCPLRSPPLCRPKWSSGSSTIDPAHAALLLYVSKSGAALESKARPLGRLDAVPAPCQPVSAKLPTVSVKCRSTARARLASPACCSHALLSPMGRHRPSSLPVFYKAVDALDACCCTEAGVGVAGALGGLRHAASSGGKCKQCTGQGPRGTLRGQCREGAKADGRLAVQAARRSSVCGGGMVSTGERQWQSGAGAVHASASSSGKGRGSNRGLGRLANRQGEQRVATASGVPRADGSSGRPACRSRCRHAR